MIHIENDGTEIVLTNYWEHEQAKAGFCFLSINAGCFRLLVPKFLKNLSVEELLQCAWSCEYVVVSCGYWVSENQKNAFEIMFEDKSLSPYCLFLISDQCDRVPHESDSGRDDFDFVIYNQSGKLMEKKCCYRKVKLLICEGFL